MTTDIHIGPAQARVRIIPRKGGTSPIALAIFLIAYLGIVVVVLAPRGTFAVEPVAARIGR